MNNPYFPLLFSFLLAIAIPIAFVILSAKIGPKKPSAAKLSPYECGIPSRGAPHERFPVKFYLVAILFLLFDIEVVFLFPWAVVFREMGSAALAPMILFLAVLLFGLAYVWKRGALEWD
ncbi:MAG: NADH-quinone oxidoreductase subunit A [bacterium]